MSEEVRCDVVTVALSLLILVEAQRDGVDLRPITEMLQTALQLLTQVP